MITFNAQNPTIHFITGPHRSGSTYLQTLLASMPNVGTGPETHFFCRILPYLKELSITQSREITFPDIKHAIQQIAFLGETRIDCWDKIETAYSRGGYRELFIYLLWNLSLNIKGQINTLIEKTPDHLCHIHKIEGYFPDAKFIINIRDPRAIATSLLRFWPNLNQKKRYSYLYHEIKYLRARFNTIHQCEMNSANNIITVKYEELVSETDRILKYLCGFLEIPFSRGYTSEYTRVASLILLDADEHKQENLGHKTNRNFEPWKKALSSHEQFFLEILLYDILTLFNYPQQYRLKKATLKVIRWLMYKWAEALPNWEFPTKSNTLIDRFTPWAPSLQKDKV